MLKPSRSTILCGGGGVGWVRDAPPSTPQGAAASVAQETTAEIEHRSNTNGSEQGGWPVSGCMVHFAAEFRCYIRATTLPGNFQGFGDQHGKTGVRTPNLAHHGLLAELDLAWCAWWKAE